MVVTYEDLQAITGYKNPNEVAGCLIRQGIKFFTGIHKRPWTTLGAIELAMGATAIHQEMAEERRPIISFD
jgi:hypothetical protein